MIDTQIFKEGATLRTAVIFYYLANEGLSIVENAARLGLPVPDKLKIALEQLTDDEEVTDENAGGEEDEPEG